MTAPSSQNPDQQRSGLLLNRLANQLVPFYRRFPYLGPMPITRVDPRGAISPPDRFFYSRIPKAANTTITDALAEGSSYRYLFRKRSDSKTFFLRPAYVSGRTTRSISDDYFKFTFVRDPYSRTLSAFLSKIIIPTRRARPFHSWYGLSSSRAPEFSDFVQFLDEGGLYADMHWAPQTDIMLMPLECFDFIGKVETLDEDLRHVRGRLFGRSDDPARRAGVTTAATQQLDKYYTAESRAVVARLFAQDFARLGYAT